MSIINKKFIFNISPTRVVGAITYFDKKKNIPIIDFYSEKKIILKKDFSLKDFREETLKAINSVCESFIKDANIYESNNSLINTAEVFLTTPWVDYENYTILDESLTPFFTGEEYLNNFLIKEKQFLDREMLSSEITAVKANDYDLELLEIENKKIQKLSISFLDSYFKKFDKHFIDGAIRNHFSLIKINFNSFLPVLFNQIHKIYNIEDDFIFLDINSEITEFGVFQDNEVKNIITIPFGINKIIFKIQDIFNLDFNEARGYLKMYLDGHLEKEKEKLIKDIFYNEKKRLENELFKKNNNSKMPKKVFLVASYPETNKIIKEFNLFEELFFIDIKFLENFVDFNTINRDNFIAIETEYVYDKEFFE